uniref:Uncharacterized protein n=1 Tax=Timema cristinae TaxID=61476 RepID=A0A7R9HEZ1_TIMCR|nr:unnamed protein product [Timema cristinae]
MIELESFSKILGFLWNPVQYQFLYQVQLKTRQATKSVILFMVVRSYDPLGYLAAVINVLFSEEVCGKETPFTILHSRTVDHEEVHCLLLHIDDKSAAGDSKETAPVFHNMLEWVTLVQGDSSIWSVRSVRQLCGPGNLDYTAIEDTCSSVYIASDKQFHFTMDSENTIVEVKTQPLPITGWVELQQKPGQEQIRDRRLVRAKTNKLGTRSSQLGVKGLVMMS